MTCSQDTIRQEDTVEESGVRIKGYTDGLTRLPDDNRYTALAPYPVPFLLRNLNIW